MIPAPPAKGDTTMSATPTDPTGTTTLTGTIPPGPADPAPAGGPLVAALLALLDGDGDVEAASREVARLDEAALTRAQDRLRRLDGLVRDAHFETVRRALIVRAGFRAGDLVRWNGEGEDHPGEWFTARLTVPGGVAGHWQGTVVDPGTLTATSHEPPLEVGQNVPNLIPRLLTLIDRPITDPA